VGAMAVGVAVAGSDRSHIWCLVEVEIVQRGGKMRCLETLRVESSANVLAPETVVCRWCRRSEIRRGGRVSGS
jgi:hypothetical protein